MLLDILEIPFFQFVSLNDRLWITQLHELGLVCVPVVFSGNCRMYDVY